MRRNSRRKATSRNAVSKAKSKPKATSVHSTRGRLLHEAVTTARLTRRQAQMRAAGAKAARVSVPPSSNDDTDPASDGGVSDEKAAQASDGEDGEDGEDGKPEAGEDGEDGEDGKSPEGGIHDNESGEASDGGVGDENAAQAPEGEDGEDGKSPAAGEDGQDGEDGKSPEGGVSDNAGRTGSEEDEASFTADPAYDDVKEREEIRLAKKGRGKAAMHDWTSTDDEEQPQPKKKTKKTKKTKRRRNVKKKEGADAEEFAVEKAFADTLTNDKDIDQDVLKVPTPTPPSRMPVLSVFRGGSYACSGR